MRQAPGPPRHPLSHQLTTCSNRKELPVMRLSAPSHHWISSIYPCVATSPVTHRSTRSGHVNGRLSALKLWLHAYAMSKISWLRLFGRELFHDKLSRSYLKMHMELRNRDTDVCIYVDIQPGIPSCTGQALVQNEPAHRVCA
jgi:hypothetical protein